MMRLWIVLGALNALVSVAAGAYGRHGALDPAGREMFGIASHYQMTHALALLAVAWLASRGDARWPWLLTFAGAAFSIGIVLFCGSLYAFGMTGAVAVPGAAPVGGTLMMVGWLAIAIAGAVMRRGSLSR